MLLDFWLFGQYNFGGYLLCIDILGVLYLALYPKSLLFIAVES